jgi:hypothetical protein
MYLHFLTFGICLDITLAQISIHKRTNSMRPSGESTSAQEHQISTLAAVSVKLN